MSNLLPVAEARRLIVEALTPVRSESVFLAQALGRVLRTDAVARVAHPPADVSAMDGYAVRAGDVAEVPCRLKIVGEAAAGHLWRGAIGEGEAVRIFTGACVPDGGDAIVIQEDTERDGTAVVIKERPILGKHIRPMGQDFTVGQTTLKAPRRLTARDIGLLAAMNIPQVEVSRRPRVGVLSTGDEIVMPGEAVGPGQIVSANGPGLCAFIRRCGGEDIHLGVVRDEIDALKMALTRAEPLDLLVTSGGVSVGEHDLMAKVFGETGTRVGFHKVAMRPGKPLLFGTLKGLPILGLPGNPVSAMVCAILFLRSAIERLVGLPGDPPMREWGTLGAPLKANDSREDYLRATLAMTGGRIIATPFPRQDSAMIAALANADAFIVRPPHAGASETGDPVEFIRLADLA
jgi:molybdopterin molybdotransferase